MSKMRLSMKIAVLLGVLAVVAALIAILSVISLGKVNTIVQRLTTQSAPKLVVSGEMEKILLQAELSLRNLLIIEDPAQRKKITAELEKLDQQIQTKFASLDTLMGSARTEEMKSVHLAWTNFNSIIHSVCEKANKNTQSTAIKLSIGESGAAYAVCIVQLNELADMLSKSSAFAARPTLERVNQARFLLNTVQRMEKDAILEVDQEKLRDLVQQSTGVLAALDKEMDFIGLGQKLPRVIRDKCKILVESYAKAKDLTLDVFNLAENNADFEAFTIEETSGKDARENFAKQLNKVATEALTAFETETRVSAEEYWSAVAWQVGLSVACIVIALVLAFIYLRKITGNLNVIITSLSDSFRKVDSAAKSLEKSSRDLAQSSRDQASNLQQTSATLEEMASMTRENASTAHHTNETTNSTVKLVEFGSVAVSDMSKAMGEINEQSGKIGAIIKTIEEIAFQTNLLALNAAVEAARAGEAGKGFAVVADEVRNLAQRSAQAARDTSELIQSSIIRIRNGSEIASRLADSFKEIEQSTREFKILVEKITSAIEEQSHGVDQVNTTVAHLDRTTQTNAEHSEDSAKVSFALTEQAREMADIVQRLHSIVNGERAGDAPAYLDDFSDNDWEVSKTPKQIAAPRYPALPPPSLE